MFPSSKTETFGFEVRPPKYNLTRPTVLRGQGGDRPLGTTLA